MKRFFRKKEITAMLLAAVIFLFSAVNLIANYPALSAAVLPEETEMLSLSGYLTGVEDAINEAIIGRYFFIESYGALQVLLGKNELNGFEEVRDNSGVLHNTYFANGISREIDGLAEPVKVLQERAVESGAQFLVIMPPDKFVTGVTDMSPGYPYNFSIENSGYFLSQLSGMGIDTVDLRPLYEGLGWRQDELFYRTDHHWTTQSAFQAYRYLVSWMEARYGVALDSDGFYTDEENYNFIPYEQQYLGSQGRRAGTVFSGIDDFMLVYPKFRTQVHFEIEEYGISQGGRVEDALINLQVLNLERDIYEKDYYGMYLHGTLYGEGRVRNELRPDGPRVLIIRDSFACAPMVYFSTVCAEMDVIYPPYYTGDLSAKIEEGGYDFVLMMIYPGNLTESFFSSLK